MNNFRTLLFFPTVYSIPYNKIQRTHNLLTLDNAVPNNTIQPHPPSGGTNLITF